MLWTIVTWMFFSFFLLLKTLWLFLPFVCIVFVFVVLYYYIDEIQTALYDIFLKICYYPVYYACTAVLLWFGKKLHMLSFSGFNRIKSLFKDADSISTANKVAASAVKDAMSGTYTNATSHGNTTA